MHSYTVSLRIESPTLDVSSVTEDLGVAPTQTRAAGQYRSPTSVFEKALWEFDMVPEELDVALENRPQWPQWESLEAAFKKLLGIFSNHASIFGSMASITKFIRGSATSRRVLMAVLTYLRKFSKLLEISVFRFGWIRISSTANRNQLLCVRRAGRPSGLSSTLVRQGYL